MTADSADSARVAALLTEKTVCIDCIAQQMTIPSERAHDLVQEIGSTLNVSEETGRCSLCASVRLVYRMM
jgi:hypothetical protein